MSMTLRFLVSQTNVNGNGLCGVLVRALYWIIRLISSHLTDLRVGSDLFDEEEVQSLTQHN